MADYKVYGAIAEASRDDVTKIHDALKVSLEKNDDTTQYIIVAALLMLDIQHISFDKYCWNGTKVDDKYHMIFKFSSDKKQDRLTESPNFHMVKKVENKYIYSFKTPDMFTTLMLVFSGCQAKLLSSSIDKVAELPDMTEDNINDIFGEICDEDEAYENLSQKNKIIYGMVSEYLSSALKSELHKNNPGISMVLRAQSSF